MSCSKATVERAFSGITNILSDRILSLNYNSMRMMLLIKINDYSWPESERKRIIKEATEKYFETTMSTGKQ